MEGVCFTEVCVCVCGGGGGGGALELKVKLTILTVEANKLRSNFRSNRVLVKTEMCNL